MKTLPIQLQNMSIKTIRFLSADEVEKTKSGHTRTPLGLAPLAYVLWKLFLKQHPKNHKWPDRDRFILSAEHAFMLLYSLLYLMGYDLILEDIKPFQQWGRRATVHVTRTDEELLTTLSVCRVLGFGMSYAH